MRTDMLKIEMETGNAAFADSKMWEAARLLRIIASKIEKGYTDGPIIDINGNTVGTWTLEGD